MNNRFRVFHGNFTPTPPHLQEDNPIPGFHAGTQKAAEDLLRMKIEAPGIPDEELPERAYMHEYEINGPVISQLLDDPMDWEQSSGKPSVDHLNYPGRLGDKILRYKNSLEDKGSVSYVIPKHLVGTMRVKHLGSQFWGDKVPHE